MIGPVPAAEEFLRGREVDVGHRRGLVACRRTCSAGARGFSGTRARIFSFGSTGGRSQFEEVGPRVGHAADLRREVAVARGPGERDVAAKRQLGRLRASPRPRPRGRSTSSAIFVPTGRPLSSEPVQSSRTTSSSASARHALREGTARAAARRWGSARRRSGTGSPSCRARACPRRRRRSVRRAGRASFAAASIAFTVSRREG